MKAPNVNPPGKQLSVQSVALPDDMPPTEFDWFDFMVNENKIAIGDRKLSPFPEDENGNIISYEN